MSALVIPDLSRVRDALQAALGAVAQADAAPGAPVTLFLPVFADDGAERPDYAYVDLTPAFLAEVERLRIAALACDLYIAVAWRPADGWGPDDPACGEWRIECQELHVDADGWQLRGLPKHADYNLWTWHVGHEETRELLRQARAKGRRYAVCGDLRAAQVPRRFRAPIKAAG
jgi:hypothetical protein